MKKYTIEYLQNLASKKNGECLSTEYINYDSKLDFRCKDGHIWSAEARNVINGTWCPKCNKGARKYEIDHEFFSRDNEESFYVAGFLAADGWKVAPKYGYQIGLYLGKKDLGHLQLIRKLLKNTNPLKYRKKFNKLNNKYSDMNGFTFNSKQCYNDLDRFGVCSSKTYILRFPEWLKNHPLVHHYMRGYIDGDGCYYYDKSNKSVGFCMRGTKEFLEEFHKIILNNNVCDKNIKRKQMQHINGKKFAAFDTLRYGGNQILSRMYDFIYKDATIFLPRKEDIIIKSKQIILDNDKRIIKLTKDEFLIESNKVNSVKELSKLLKCATWAIYNYINIYNIANEIKFIHKRKPRYNSLGFTKEILLKDLQELGSGKEVAKKYNCSDVNIYWWIKRLGISKQEYNEAVFYKTANV